MAVDPPREEYRIINDLLGSKSAGILFRRSPSLTDKTNKIAKFGSSVVGVRRDADWLQVGRYFLPFQVDGCWVLLRQEYADQTEPSQAVARGRRGNLKEEEDEWDEPGMENVHPLLAGHIKAQRREAAEREERRRQKGAAMIALFGRKGDKDTGGCGEIVSAGRRRAPGDGGVADEAPLPELGTGAMYEVVAKEVRVRSWPGEVFDDRPDDDGDVWVQAPNSARYLRKKMRVEMFDWDESWQLRRFVCLEMTGRPLTGWVPLDLLGPVLRPIGLLSRKLPMDPVHAAVHEGNMDHLKRAIDARLDLNRKDDNGLTPLMVAAQHGRGEMCLLLLHGGADASVAANGVYGAKRAADLADTTCQVLVRALSGDDDFNVQAFDATISRLRPELQEVAEAVLEKVARRKAAERLREQRALAANPPAPRVPEARRAPTEEEQRREDAEPADLVAAISAAWEKLEVVDANIAHHMSPKGGAPCEGSEDLVADVGVDRRQEGRGPEPASELDPSVDHTTGVEAAEEEGEQWTCAECGFDTPSASLVCAFCDTPRGAGLAGQATVDDG